jgi:TM2 domain-containing membrane protein YozV
MQPIPTPEQLENRRLLLQFWEIMGQHNPAITSTALIAIALIALIALVMAAIAIITAIVGILSVRRYTARVLFLSERRHLVAAYAETNEFRGHLLSADKRAALENVIVKYEDGGHAALDTDQSYLLLDFDEFCETIEKPRSLYRTILMEGGFRLTRQDQERMLKKIVSYETWLGLMRRHEPLARRAALSISELQWEFFWRDFWSNIWSFVKKVSGSVDRREARSIPDATASAAQSDESTEVASLETVYAAKKKDLTIAYALWLVLGLLGTHRFYLNRPLTACGIPALAIASFLAPSFNSVFILACGLWMVVDAALIPIMVRDYNNDLLEALDSRFI